jgi:hypothetical protein
MENYGNSMWQDLHCPAAAVQPVSDQDDSMDGQEPGDVVIVV